MQLTTLALLLKNSTTPTQNVCCILRYQTVVLSSKVLACCLQEEESSDSETELEQLKKAAQARYANFRQEFTHMIDPNDDVELQQMEKMGLPIVFINCRADVSTTHTIQNLANQTFSARDTQAT